MKSSECSCFFDPHTLRLIVRELGMDERFAQTTILVCNHCNQPWLRLHEELEGFTASGRWYLGAITNEQAERLTAQTARATLESLKWYFYGGSYYGGRSGITSGPIF